MATYAGLVLKTAFSRWGARTDLAGGVVGVILPCGYVLAGRPVPDNASVLVAEIAVGVVLGLVIIRLMAAPYLIWLADQGKIKDLQKQLDDPARERRERFLAAQEAVRMEFAQEVSRYTDGVKASIMVTNFTYEILEQLESRAVMFNYDSDFETLWRRFTDALESERSVLSLAKDRPDPDGFIEVQVNRNLNYYFQIRRVTGRAIVSFLTYNKTYWLDCQKEMNRIAEDYEAMGRVPIWDDASLDEALSSRRPQDTGSKTQP